MGVQVSGDSELIVRIASERDQAAFQELYERYAQPAYNLALYLTHNPTEAEDTVQNAFVNVWRFAGKFRESGTPRSWLLRIVANAAMRVKRDRRAYQVPIEIVDTAATAPFAQRADPERAELHAALRKGIETLPEPTRQVIALYYGANCTQSEIGEMLKLPQTTVSLKLREAVEKLRLSLAGAGMAAAAPLLESGALGDALLTGKPVPPSLGAKVFGNLAKAADITQRVSRRAAPLAGNAAMVIAAAVIAAGAAVAWLAVPPSGQAPAGGASGGEAAATQEPAAAPKAAAPERIHGKWSFAEGKRPGFEEFGGQWQWVPAEGARPAGMMTADHQAKCGLQIPLEVPPHRCWEVRIRAYQLPGAVGLALHAELGAKSPATRYTLFRRPFEPLRNGGLIETINYIQDDANWNSVTFWADGGKHRLGTVVTRFDVAYERIPHVLVGAMGVVITEIELREVAREEIPEDYRDLERLVADQKLKPEARRMNRNSQQVYKAKDEPKSAE